MEAPEESREPLYSIRDEKEWERFREEELPDVLEDTGEEATENAGVLWRGMDPETLLAFLRGELGSIDIHAEKNRPNASSDIHDSIAYTSEDNPYPFNAAIGFKPNARTMRIGRGHLAPDTPMSARRQDDRFYVLDGSVHPEDVRFFTLRFYGDPDKGESGPHEEKRYRVNREGFQALRAAMQKRAA